MSVSLYLAFVLATVILVAIPGPTVLVITSISIRRGVRAGLIAVLGSSLAASIYLAVVVAGLASVVTLVSEWFVWVRLLGAGYLVYLGVRAWISASAGRSVQKPNHSGVQEFGKGFVTTATNPKMLFFLGAFFPQFIDPSLAVLPQLSVLGVSFLILLTVLDGCWVVLASMVGLRFRSRRSQVLANKVAGTVLVGAGASLALARQA